MDKSLSVSLGKSLTSEVANCMSNLLETGLDSVLEDGILKDIPFISTIISLYKIGNSLHDRHNIKKLAAFVDEINAGIADEGKRESYRKKFNDNKRFHEELEYLLILIDRYIGFQKPRMLGRLFLSYQDKLLTWNELAQYAQIIDRFLPGDYLTLCNTALENVTLEDDRIDAVLRLSSMGLVSQDVVSISKMVDGMEEVSATTGFSITSFGQKLKDQIGVLDDQ